ncbi:hypothetical protein GCM10010440_15640 [Kitasatospora cinereorecta]
MEDSHAPYQGTSGVRVTSQITCLKQKGRQEVQDLLEAPEQAHRENPGLRRTLDHHSRDTPRPQVRRAC